MEIVLASENAYQINPRFVLEVAIDRAEQKKASLVAGAVSALITRPKPEEIQMLSVENRLEPFWQVTIASRTVFDRNKTFNISISGPEVKSIHLLGQDLLLEPKGSESPGLTLSGVEHCVDQARSTGTFDGITGLRSDMSKYMAFPKTPIPELEGFAPAGVVVIPPQVRATAVVREVMAEVIRPVQQAHVIHEEHVDVEAIDLIFRPVYAMELEWGAKGKRTVVEFDALTGEMRAGGKKMGEQFKGFVTRDLLFDITADAVGLIVPGGSIAVKLVKAVVDRGK